MVTIELHNSTLGKRKDTSDTIQHNLTKYDVQGRLSELRASVETSPPWRQSLRTCLVAKDDLRRMNAQAQFQFVRPGPRGMEQRRHKS